MTLTKDLRELETARCAYALVIDGSPSIFVTDEDLEGDINTTGSWIYTDRGHTSASVTASMRFPTSLPMEIDLRESDFVDLTTTFELNDIDGGLVNLFKVEDSSKTKLRDTIFPTDDPLPATKLDTKLSGVLGKHVGHEFIGASGERHQNPCFISGSTNFQIGMFHPGVDFVGDSPVVPVSDSPLTWAGRKFCLYRIYQDVTVDSPGVSDWRPLSESPMIYWGTIRDVGKVERKDWRIQADGPASWVRGPLNRNVDDESRTFQISSSLSENERKVGAFLYAAEWTDPEDAWDYSQVDFSVVPFDRTVSDSSQNAAINDLQGIFNNMLEDRGGGTLADALENYKGGGGALQWNSTFNDIRVKGADWADKFRAVYLRLVLHEKLWARLGFSIEQRNFDIDEQKYVSFVEKDTLVTSAATSGVLPAPTDGFVEGMFSTIPLGYEPRGGVGDLLADGEQARVDNDGEWRVYSPQFKGGVLALDGELNDGDGIVIHINADSYKCQGQLFRPPAGTLLGANLVVAKNISGVGDVDSTRLFVFHGPRRIIETDEVFEEIQVAKCSWKKDTNNPGLIATDSENFKPTLVVEEWLDPKLFGFDRPILKGQWLGIADGLADEDDRIKVVPLAVWKYFTEGHEKAINVIQRILSSTGTSTGWDSFEIDPNAKLDPGDNNRTGMEHNGQGIIRDAEIADLGLAVPRQMIHAVDEWEPFDKRLSDGFNLTSLRHRGVVNAEDLLRGVMQPRGLQWRLHGAKYGVFDTFQLVNPADAEVTIGVEDIVGDPNDPANNWPRMEMRVLRPIDTVKLESNFDPLKSDFVRDDLEYRSTDDGAHYRRHKVTHTTQEWGLNRQGATSWTLGWQNVWQRGTEFWAKRHFQVEYDLHRIKGEQCWPGTKVLLTDPRLINQSGIYGVTSFSGVITSVIRHPNRETDTVRILVHQANALGFSLFAPMARVRGLDTVNDRIYVDRDFLRVGQDHNDASMFVEPDWSSLGGNAIVKVYRQHKRGAMDWEEMGTGRVSSVGTANNTAYLQLTEELGFTWLRDEDKFVVMEDLQGQEATWVTSLYAPIGSDLGVDGDGDAVKEFL